MIKYLILLTSLLLVFQFSSTAQKKQSLYAAAYKSINEPPKGRTFPVSKVKTAPSLLTTDSLIAAFETKIDKPIIHFPSEQKSYQVVYCANNGLIQTIQECYDNHRPLVLTPDIIWLAICQGVSIHLNENFDSLQHLIFTSNKPEQIIIRNDSLEFGTEPWLQLIEQFTLETQKYTHSDYYSFFVPTFSTTTKIETTAYQVTMLESFKKAFDYIAETGCGIPYITITGSSKDWEIIFSKLDKLNELGLAQWADNLKPIIRNFIEAVNGNIDTYFWNDIYKNATEYNAFFISGWIIKFFPYIKTVEATDSIDEVRQETIAKEVYKPNEFITGKNYQLSTLSTDNFPSGIAKIEIVWNNYKKKYTKRMVVYSGFFAIRQYDDKSLEPLISWAIGDNDEKSQLHKTYGTKNLNLEHADYVWSPHISKKPVREAIYNPKRFKTTEEGNRFVGNYLLEAIKKNKQFENITFTNDTLEFIIFQDGSVGKTTIRGKNATPQLIQFITNKLESLPNIWFPALTHPADIIYNDFDEEFNRKTLIRASSTVKIAF